MAVLFLSLIAFIAFVFALVLFGFATLMESLFMYYPLFKLWIVFTAAFIIQTVVAIISKIKKKKFGKGNVIRSIILGIIAFVLFSVFIILTLLKNFQEWKELYLTYFS